MSLQVNLSAKEIAVAYSSVLDGSDGDWMILTYEKGSNDLKVQAQGSGGLDELEEEFLDGRIQYAFARVKDPNTQLSKYVQINWCGDGVPEAKKGLFHSHSAAVSRFLKNAHVVIGARNEGDVTPSLIMKRVREASGAKYSVHNEPSKRPEPIAPVGTSYTPIGKVDIASVRAAAAPPRAQASTTATMPSSYSVSRPAKPSASIVSVSQTKSITPLWDDEARVAAPPPIPVSFGSTSISTPPFSKLTHSAQEDNVGPIGTAYKPVSLPSPKKLVNPFESRQQQAAEAPILSASRAYTSAGPKKLTWSEREALAKKQQEDKVRSQAAIQTAAAVPKFGPVEDAEEPTPIAPASRRMNSPQKEYERAFVPQPPPPPSTFVSEPDLTLPLPSFTREPEPDTPPPFAAMLVAVPEPAQQQEAKLESLDVEYHTHRTGKGLCAIVQYAYEATEDNEMNLLEGELIEQIEQLDEGWWQGVGDSGLKSGLFPANYVELIATSDEPVNDVESSPPPPPPPPPPPAPLSPTPEPEPTTESALVNRGTVAVALYDYDAGEDNEISFREREQITHVEAISEDWWQGTAPDGSFGLFPANYVELQ